MRSFPGRPRNCPTTGRHLLGISEPFDLFEAVDAGIDTFDCVNPSRVARNAAIYTPQGRFNLTNARYARDFAHSLGMWVLHLPSFTRAYVRHLFKAKEILAATLATIHNEWFTVRLVDAIRTALVDGRLGTFARRCWGRSTAAASRTHTVGRRCCGYAR